MNFLGQPHIIKQLQFLLPEVYAGASANFLLRGPSGYGKTTLALSMCSYLTGGDFNMGLGNSYVFRPEKRVQFVDEVHLLPTPETLYPIMDAGTYVFILATNDAAILPEALVNRCFGLTFTEYSRDELKEMIRSFAKFAMSAESMDYIIRSSGGNPRILISLLKRLNILAKQSNLSGMRFVEFQNLVQEVFGIVDGLDVACRRYVEVLSSLGGRGSLDTLSGLLHIDKETIRYQIEPILLYNDRINITSRGRILKGAANV